MVNRDTPWPDGTPCWIDLMTTDASAARQFYAALFGWDIEVGSEETGFYGMCTVGGRTVAGIGELPDGPPAGMDDLPRCVRPRRDREGDRRSGRDDRPGTDGRHGLRPPRRRAGSDRRRRSGCGRPARTSA